MKEVAARVEWNELFPPTKIRIRLDANNGTPTQYLIHELLHIVFHDLFLGHVDDSMEEAAIVAWDQYIYEYVKKSPARSKSWSDLIEKKLAEDKEPTSLEELADRKG